MTAIITPLPTPPTRQDSANFNDRADAFLGALPLFQQEANALAVDISNILTEVDASKAAAISVTGITKWIANTNYSEGQSVWSPMNGLAYRKITDSVGSATDPSLDSVNYVAITGAASIVYELDTVNSVVSNVNNKLKEFISVKDFKCSDGTMVLGDGVHDDTTGIQAALDSEFNNIYFPEGTYQFSNLSLPNKRLTLFGAGHWRTTLRCSSPVNSNYGIASSAYIGNATNGNEPVTLREITVNGNGLVDFPLVVYGYFSEVRNCRIVNSKTGGFSLKLTSNGISGSVCSTTLVENKIIDCTISGGDGNAFTMVDSGSKCTDMMIRGNIFSDGDSVLRSMAGHCVTDNHFYAGTVTLNRLSVGTIISNNYFENNLILDDFVDEVVGISNNRFLSRVSVNFGTSGKTCVFDNNIWQGSADLFHNYFATDKRIIVNGGGFETPTPFVFHNSSSTGWISSNRVWNYSSNSFLTGSRQAAISSIRSELPFAPVVSSNYGDVGATLTWTSSATTNRWNSTLTSDKVVTLSTTNAINGAKFKIVRTGGGAFNLIVGTGPLKNLAANQWCEVEYDGSAWILSAYGTL